MDKYEGISYSILGFLAFMYVIAMIVGFIAAFPWGLLGLALAIAVGVLFLKVIKERCENKEDDYYAKEVNK